MKTFDRIVIHHSASPRRTTFSQIVEWHLARGWRDIGYHYVIDDFPRLHVGRRLPETGAHTKGYNGSSIGICVTGDNTAEVSEWTLAQWELLADHCASLLDVFTWLGKRDLVRHSSLVETECPAITDERWAEFRQQVLRRIRT